jgi:hypothetical protein
MLWGFKIEGATKGLVALLLIVALMLAIPPLWSYISHLELFNYMSGLTQVFK